jgi:hypothetical protein
MAAPPEEVEVDLGRYVRRVTSRWYIVVACVLAAVAVAVLAGTNSKKSYRATTLLYLGLPVGANGAPLTSSLCTNPATPGILLKQEAVLAKGAKAAGLETSKLRGRASTAVEKAAITKTNFTAIVRVIVVGPWRLKAQQASNALAQAIRDECGGIARERQGIFRKVIIEQEADLARQRELETSIEQSLSDLSADSGLSRTDRLLAVQAAQGRLTAVGQRIGLLTESLTENRINFAQTQDVEVSRIVTPARSVRVTAATERASLLIAGLLGLLVGVVVALLSYSVHPRRRENA